MSVFSAPGDEFEVTVPPYTMRSLTLLGKCRTHPRQRAYSHNQNQVPTKIDRWLHLRLPQSGFCNLFLTGDSLRIILHSNELHLTRTCERLASDFACTFL